MITPEKLSNFEYLKSFIKEFCIRFKNLKFEDIYTILIEEYPFIKINLSEKEKTEEIKIEEIVNIKSLIKRALINLSKFTLSKKIHYKSNYAYERYKSL